MGTGAVRPEVDATLTVTGDYDAMTTLDAKIAHLRDLLAELEQVVVCFSGGVDSGYLLAEAVGVLGDRAVALTAVSPSLASEEGAAARNPRRAARGPGICSSIRRRSTTRATQPTR